jgi:heme/copper-type cytochrome/quinol oxidase subunit 4
MSTRVRKSILRFGGGMLVVLGILHLAVTPFIARLITDNVTEAVGVWLTPPMLLNHVIVGILLLPLGILTFYAAPSAVARERWALIVTRVSAITVATLPLVLFLVMGSQYFSAIPFVVATIIVCVAALTLLAAAFWPNSTRRLTSRSS